MNEKYYYIIAMVVSGGLLSLFSVRYHWSISIWSKINTKIKTVWNVPMWFVIVIVTQIIIQLILEQFSLNSATTNVALGIGMGAMLAIMPNLSCAINNRK